MKFFSYFEYYVYFYLEIQVAYHLCFQRDITIQLAKRDGRIDWYRKLGVRQYRDIRYG